MYDVNTGISFNNASNIFLNLQYPVIMDVIILNKTLPRLKPKAAS